MLRVVEENAALPLTLNLRQDVAMQVDNPQQTVEMIKHGEIDESLYSRQL